MRRKEIVHFYQSVTVASHDSRGIQVQRPDGRYGVPSRVELPDEDLGALGDGAGLVEHLPIEDRQGAVGVAEDDVSLVDVQGRDVVFESVAVYAAPAVVKV